MGGVFQLILTLLMSAAICTLIASLCTAALFSKRATIADKVLFGITALGWWGMVYLQATTGAQTNIRIDLVLFGPILLGLAVGSLTKWMSLHNVQTNSETRNDYAISLESKPLKDNAQNRSGNAWALVLGIIVGCPLILFTWMVNDTHDTSQRIESGHQFRFDAAFRNDETQLAFFGDIKSAADTWAGFYEFETQDDRFKYIVINKEGRSWLFNRNKWNLRNFSSVNANKNGKPFLTKEIKEEFGFSDITFTLRPAADNKFEFEIGPGTHNTEVVKIPARLINPPRFPVVNLATDKVKFLGAYSGKYQIKEKSFWAVELWLWQDKDGLRGRYYRNHFTSGNVYNSQFQHHRIFDVTCKANCLTKEGVKIKTPEYDEFTLKRIENDQFQVTYSWEKEPVLLTRGALIPDPLYELAPLTNWTENKKWLDAVAIGRNVTWKVP
jgi:hypothetical protein